MKITFDVDPRTASALLEVRRSLEHDTWRDHRRSDEILQARNEGEVQP